MDIQAFDYELPREFIAQYPSERGKTKLFVVHRDTGKFEHRKFSNIVEYISANDCLVVNETRVLPARLFGKRRTGGKVEILLLRKLEGNKWEVLAGPGRKAPQGEIITFNERLKCKILGKNFDFGTRIAEFSGKGNIDELIEEIGNIPLPPYIKRTPEPIDKERYQTVYGVKKGAVAAPTAGLHFTDEILSRIREKGTRIVRILLHTGLGTFRPVKSTRIELHRMEPEYMEISEDAAKTINETKKNGGRIVAVGTTVVRSLESAVDKNGNVLPKQGDTNIYIYPPYKFKAVDVLLTNFHLPKSTLLILTSAFASRELILKAYKEATKQQYKFYSYGDAMLIL